VILLLELLYDLSTSPGPPVSASHCDNCTSVCDIVIRAIV